MAIGLLLAFTVGASRFGPGGVLALPLIVSGVGLLIVSGSRPGLGLGFFLLYLGLADGYLKLSTGSDRLPVVRDVLLVGILVGVAVRAAVSRQRATAPPLLTYVVLFVAAAAVQVLNPELSSLRTFSGGLRQHLEFVPLFFLGFAFMRTPHRLKGYLVLLVVVGAANGLVGVLQFNLSPEQLASWGPGYAERVLGEGDFAGAGRVFADEAGNGRVRPFGLGSDAGFGGALAMISLPAAIALFTTVSTRWRWLAAAGVAACALGTVTSQSRLAVAGGIAMVITYGILAAPSRKRASAFAGFGVALALMAVVVSLFLSADTSGSTRYETLAPGEIVETAQDSRGVALAAVPQTMLDYPLGAGIGRTGPAGAFSREGSLGLNAENQILFLTVELGIVGVVVLFGLALSALVFGLRSVWATSDRVARAHLAAFVTPLAGFLALSLFAAVTPTTPWGPYLWFACGVVSYLMTSRGRATLIEISETAH